MSTPRRHPAIATLATVLALAAALALAGCPAAAPPALAPPDPPAPADDDDDSTAADDDDTTEACDSDGDGFPDDIDPTPDGFDGADGREQPLSVQTHLHGSLSEFDATMAWHTAQAAANDVDVLWWTDHDNMLLTNPIYLQAP